MPGFKVHKKIGSIAALVFSILFIAFFYKQIPITGWKLLLIPLVVIVYSQIPDLDSHSSRIKKRSFQAIFWLMAISTILALIINQYYLFGLLSIAGIFGLFLYKIPHRGPLHSFWFIALAAFPLLFLHWFLALLAFVCAASHLIADRVFSSTKRKIKKAFGIQSTYEVNIRL